MAGIARLLSAGSRALSYLLGGAALVLAVAVALTTSPVAEIVDWAERILGVAFVAVVAGLAYVVALAFAKVSAGHPAAAGHRTWFEAGQQAASGIATVALTYTLLGISLGIGGLADQVLTPDTVQGVIRQLTPHFSTAFMTTVIGLPLSAALRAVLGVAYSRSLERQACLPAR